MIIKGVRGPYFMGQRRERTGDTLRITDTWIGTQAEVNGINLSGYNGGNVSRIGDSPMWTVEAWKDTAADGGAIVDSYEINYNTKLDALRYSPVLQGYLTREQIGFVDETFAAMQRGDISYDEAKLDVRAFVPAEANAAQQVLDWAVADINNYYTFDYVFTWTRSAASGISIPINYSNVEDVYATSSAMLTGEGADPSFVLPSKQWFKLPVAISEQLEGRIEVKYEYWGADNWSEYLYDPI